MVLILLAAFGFHLSCSESELLQTDLGNVTLAVESEGNDALDYETAEFGLIQVFFRPQDPVADAELGAEPLGFLISAEVVDLTQARIEFPPLRLKSGAYRVDRIVTQPSGNDFLELIDDNPGNVGDPGHTCLEDALARVVADQGDDPVARLPSVNTTGDVSIQLQLDFRNDPNPPVFTVPDSGAVTLTLRIDSVGLVEAFEDSFICLSDPARTCSGIGGTESAPCLSDFVSDNFNPVWPQFFTIE